MGNFYGPYSYSRISTFKKCPLKFKYAYIDRIPMDSAPSPAMERGTEIHSSIENFLLGKEETLHPDIHENYGQFFYGLRHNFTCYPEEPFGFTRDFEPCEYDDPNVFARGIIDLRIAPKEGGGDEHQVYDHKTGKIYPDHVDQRAFYGVGTLVKLPDIERITVSNIYVDQIQHVSTTYVRNALVDLKDVISRDIQKIEEEEIFPPMPTYACRWCKFSRHNGGPCRF